MNSLDEYRKLRPKIKTGDVVQWKGNGLIAWLIRRWSKFSHSSLVVKFGECQGLKNRVWLVEALASGLEFRLLSRELMNYDGKAWLLSVQSTTLQRIKIRDFAMTACSRGVGYDYGSLFSNIFGRVSVDAERYFCSEFVWKAALVGGIVKNNKKAPRPGDLAKWLPNNGLSPVLTTGGDK